MAGGAKARRLLLAGALLLLRLLDLPWATVAVRRSDFPASFLFGTATSSYQVIPPSTSISRLQALVVSSVIRMRSGELRQNRIRMDHLSIGRSLSRGSWNMYSFYWAFLGSSDYRPTYLALHSRTEGLLLLI